MDWQQRQRGHAQFLEVGNGCGMRQPGVCALLRCGNAGQTFAETLDVHLIQNQISWGVARRIEAAWRQCGGCSNTCLQGRGRVVARVHAEWAVGMAQRIAVVFGTPFKLTHDLARIGVQQ